MRWGTRGEHGPTEHSEEKKFQRIQMVAQHGNVIGCIEHSQTKLLDVADRKVALFQVDSLKIRWF